MVETRRSATTLRDPSTAGACPGPSCPAAGGRALPHLAVARVATVGPISPPEESGGEKEDLQVPDAGLHLLATLQLSVDSNGARDIESLLACT